MPVRTELNLKLPNSPGALSRLCRTLADERVDILALSLDPHGQLRIVVDNHVRAAGALRDQHYQLTERDVIVAAVPNSPGALASVLKLVADAGVNLDYVYGSGVDGARTAMVVLGTADPARAAAASGL